MHSSLRSFARGPADTGMPPLSPEGAVPPGAQETRRRPHRPGKRRREGSRQGGFTLVEIMVVVIILAILAATIIPQFTGTTQEAKISRAKADIATLENALERFYLRLDRYPTSEEGLRALVEPPAKDAEKWGDRYIKLLRNDPWGNPYAYRQPGIHSPSFDLWSRGPDGKDGGGDDVTNWEVEESR